MRKTRVRGWLAGVLTIVSLSAVVPACKSPDGLRYSLFGKPSPDSTNTVLRPPYPWPNTKPLYISGYAGANYDSTIRARPIYANPARAAATTTPSTITVDHGSWDSN